MRAPSPATVLSVLALVVAGTGTSYAVAKLPKDSVGAAQIKPGAVGGSEVKDGSLASGDFGAGQLPAGPQGSQGPQGPQGPQGVEGPRGQAADESQFYTKLDSDARYVAGQSGALTGAMTVLPSALYTPPEQTVLQIGSGAFAGDLRLSAYDCVAAFGGPANGANVFLRVTDLAGGTAAQTFVISFFNKQAGGRLVETRDTGGTVKVHAGEGLGTATGPARATFTIDAYAAGDPTFLRHIDGTVTWEADTQQEFGGCRITALATKVGVPR